MENNTYNTLQKRIWMVSTIIAPLLLVICQFFWKDGLVTATAGVIQMFVFFAWIFLFQGLFHAFKDTLPRFALFGFIIAVYSSMGGSHFGVDGIYSQYIGIETLEQKDALHTSLGWLTAFYLFIPGIFFPLVMLVLGIQLLRYKMVSQLAALLLIIGALGFPLSRMPRIDWLAHLDNLVLLIAHILLVRDLYGTAKSNHVMQN